MAILPGSGIVLSGCAPGTYGCLVRSGDGTLHILSAGHVLLNASADVGARVLDLENTQIASLAGWVDPTSGAPGANRVDAAIARLDDQAAAARIPGIGTPRGRTSKLRIGERVQLVGHTSNYRSGYIADLSYDAELITNLPGRPNIKVRYEHLVLCTRFTSGGDSGAAVLNDDRQIVGIHVGGTDTASFFCRITEVCRQLNVEIVT